MTIYKNLDLDLEEIDMLWQITNLNEYLLETRLIREKTKLWFICALEPNHFNRLIYLSNLEKKQINPKKV